MSKESSPKYRKWDKNQEGGVRQKERVKRGENTIINSRKLFHNTSLYTGYSSPHDPTQKLKYYTIQDYQCTAFHNNVQGCLRPTAVNTVESTRRPLVGGGQRSGLRRTRWLSALLRTFVCGTHLTAPGTSSRLTPGRTAVEGTPGRNREGGGEKKKKDFSIGPHVEKSKLGDLFQIMLRKF